MSESLDGSARVAGLSREMLSGVMVHGLLRVWLRDSFTVDGAGDEWTISLRAAPRSDRALRRGGREAARRPRRSAAGSSRPRHTSAHRAASPRTAAHAASVRAGRPPRSRPQPPPLRLPVLPP